MIHRAIWLPLLALLPAAAPAPFADCANCPKMVIIPAGEATLGSEADERARAGVAPVFGDREAPTYRVRIAHAFALGQTEVTRGQWRAFVDATHRPDPSSCGTHDARTDSWQPRPGFSWRDTMFAQTDAHPAVCISYDDAVAYTRWLTQSTGKLYRLPSDAEWEYAARAGTTTPWYWGESAEAGCGRANLLSAGTATAIGWPKSIAGRFVCADARSFTMPVASFAANPWGLYDMAGNAFEWVADCNSPDNRDAHADGSARTSGDCAHHYLKGGAFHTPFWLTRSAVRGAPIPADLHMFAVGFRVARSLD